MTRVGAHAVHSRGGQQQVILTLELTGTAGAAATSHAFGEEGGTIGRAPTSDWVLPHNKVSGLHARVSYRSGTFYIEDASRNGVCVNSPDNRLVANRPYALKTGDRLFIEPYEIGIWIGGEAARRSPVADDPFGDDPFALAAPSAAPGRPSDSMLPESPVAGEVDPLKFFEPVGAPPARPRPELPPDDGLGQHYQPPAMLPDPTPPPASPAPVIPAGYNPLADDRFGEAIVATPAPAPARPRPGDSGVLRARAREGSPADPRRGRAARPPASPPASPV
ncbi:MAG: FHA domain-containing protein, partial [Acidobacteriota bacterium]